MSLFKSTENITPISSKASNEYTMNQETIRLLVQQQLTILPEIRQMIGNNPLQLMYDNHYYRTAFMSAFLKLNNYELLARIFVWHCRVYCARGFQYKYFLIDLHAWQTAIDKVLTKESAYEIKAVYQWLIDHHEDLLNLAISDEYHVFSEVHMEGLNYIFLMHLLHGDYKACLAITEQYLKEEDTLITLYLRVIQPCLYEIGRLWEGGHVSVAQEHLATAIVSRVMLAGGTRRVADCCKGKAVFVCAPGELHELGLRMVADLLEEDGWQVDFLGASLSVVELVNYLQSCSPHFIGITVSVPFNLDFAREEIEAIRQALDLNKLKIMVGGPAFHHEDRSWRLIGADAYAIDGSAAVEIANRWWNVKE